MYIHISTVSRSCLAGVSWKRLQKRKIWNGEVRKDNSRCMKVLFLDVGSGCIDGRGGLG